MGPKIILENRKCINVLHNIVIVPNSGTNTTFGGSLDTISDIWDTFCWCCAIFLGIESAVTNHFCPLHDTVLELGVMFKV